MSNKSEYNYKCMKIYFINETNKFSRFYEKKSFKKEFNE